MESKSNQLLKEIVGPSRNVRDEKKPDDNVECLSMVESSQKHIYDSEITDQEEKKIEEEVIQFLHMLKQKRDLESLEPAILLPYKKRKFAADEIQQIVLSQTNQSSEINLSNIPEMQSNANNHSPNIQTITIQNVTNNNNISQQSAVSNDDIATTSGAKPIGKNNTLVPLEIYKNINWSSPSNATRKLLSAKFTRQVLATHSLTGKPSPAFLDRNNPTKQMLDPAIVEDIIYTVTRKCNVSPKEVRNAITSKCADETKIMRQNQRKREEENARLNNLN